MKLRTLMFACTCLLGFSVMYGQQVKGKSVVFVDYFNAPSNVQ